MVRSFIVKQFGLMNYRYGFYIFAFYAFLRFWAKYRFLSLFYGIIRGVFAPPS